MGEFSYVHSEATEWSDAGAFSYNLEESVAFQQSSSLPQNIPLLASILLERGVLTVQAAQEALSRQAETGDSLAQVLLAGGWVAPDQMVEALQVRASYG